MKLIIGLGNPGKKYAKTRHNVGFRVVDEMEKSFDATQDKNLIFLKPDTFMNNSGKAVKQALKYSSLNTWDLIVVHDDVDLLFGDIRVSKDSSSAGHKGVQSIIDELGTKDFTRIRIGIKPRGGQAEQKVDTEEFVLKNFTKNEEKELKEIIKKAVGLILRLLS
jgi:PTH1 family peptidyl-tRNA hydrolase